MTTITVTALMGRALDQELRSRGIAPLGSEECALIMERVLARMGKLANERERTEAEVIEMTKRGT